MRCARDCPGGAIPRPGERPTIKIRIEDREYEWADVHMGRCTLTHHGLNWEASPFLKKDVPGFKLDVRHSNMSEEAAYKMVYPLGTSTWGLRTPEFPDSKGVINYYNQILSHMGYFAICGAKGCIRACMDNLEKKKRIEQSDFKTPVWPRPAWKLSPPEEDQCGGIAEGKFPEQFNNPDPCPGGWK